MITGLNPWLLIGALSAAVAVFFGGVSVGKDLERADWLQAQQAQQKLVEDETARANKIAMLYGTALQTSQDTASILRRKLNEQRDQLASCIPGGGVRFVPAFASLYNDALQANASGSGKPPGEATGTDPAAVLDTHIENGRRWKACRDQANALIDILEPLQ